ncbi:aldo/keto reductase [Proteinivorax hydrogeniformans]|uniref:Aldo/keto reductase n=1 Tax=Proteinivorax hydrogeniformans TaxID=1826727 RepID=A0AAU8HWY2_9FIRM
MGNKFKLILGTMTFGPQANQEEAKKMTKHFIEKGYLEIDTAYVYNEGQSEKFLGEALQHTRHAGLSLATKVNPRVTGKLDAEAVKTQFSKSLERLKMDKVDTLYLHFPDLYTPVEEALKACAELYGKRKFKQLGLSNFPAWMVVDIWHLCKKNGWPAPKIYQGVYNGLSRKAENELFPAIRRLGIRFYAYNPLAGGILSGKYAKYTENPEAGRFTYRPNYMDRYWKESFFEAYSLLNNRCKEEGIPIVEAAYRWLMHHSLLDAKEGDGILIGASRIEQLEQNLDVANKGPLPQTILDAFELAWEDTKSESPEYFRFITKK